MAGDTFPAPHVPPAVPPDQLCGPALLGTACSAQPSNSLWDTNDFKMRWRICIRSLPLAEHEGNQRNDCLAGADATRAARGRPSHPSLPVLRLGSCGALPLRSRPAGRRGTRCSVRQAHDEVRSVSGSQRSDKLHGV